MKEKFDNLIESFIYMDYEEKKKNLKNELDELLQYYDNCNKYLTGSNLLLKPLDNYETEEEYIDMIYSYIMSIKVENTKFVNNMEKQ